MAIDPKFPDTPDIANITSIERTLLEKLVKSDKNIGDKFWDEGLTGIDAALMPCVVTIRGDSTKEAMSGDQTVVRYDLPYEILSMMNYTHPDYRSGFNAGPLIRTTREQHQWLKSYIFGTNKRGIIPQEFDKRDKELIANLEGQIAEEVRTIWGELQIQGIAEYFQGVFEGTITTPTAAIGRHKGLSGGKGRLDIYGNTELNKSYIWAVVKALDQLKNEDLTREFIDVVEAAHTRAQGIPVMAYFIDMAKTPRERGEIVEDTVQDVRHATLMRRVIGLINHVNVITNSNYQSSQNTPFYRYDGKELTHNGIVFEVSLVQ